MNEMILTKSCNYKSKKRVIINIKVLVFIKLKFIKELKVLLKEIYTYMYVKSLNKVYCFKL